MGLVYRQNGSVGLVGLGFGLGLVLGLGLGSFRRPVDRGRG